MLPKSVSVVDVMYEDYMRINAFARYNVRYETMKAELSLLKKTVDELESANMAVMDSEGQSFLRLGTGYFPLDTLEIDEILEKKKDYINEETALLEAKLHALSSEMDTLRAVLESKFGQAINLYYDK